MLVIPRSEVSETLRYLHDGSSGGHLGVTKTLEKVLVRFFCANCPEDVKKLYRKYITCSVSNGPLKKPRAPMGQYNRSGLKEINDIGYQIRKTQLRNPNESRRIKLTKDELYFEEFMVACEGTTRARFGVSF